MIEDDTVASWPFVVALLCLALAGVWAHSPTIPFDDAWFFVRFARNVWDSGIAGFNIEDGPVYGNTSQLWQWMVAMLWPLAGEHQMLAMRLLSALAWWAGSSALVVSLKQKWAPFLLLTCPVATATFGSGMETALTLGLGAGCLAAVHTKRHWALVVALCVLLFLARPDTGLLSLPLLALTPYTRKLGTLTFLAAVAALLLSFQQYYGSPVPLSFYVKSGDSSLLGEHFLALCTRAKVRHALLFGCCVLGVADLPWRRASWRYTLPALLFVGYHLFQTVDIMGMQARFFAPCLPWVAVACSLGSAKRHQGPALVAFLVAAFAFALAHWMDAVDPSLPERAVPLVLLGVLASALPIHRSVAPVIVFLCALASLPLEEGTGGTHDQALLTRSLQERTSWRGLTKSVRCLGDDVHAYHSEIGVIGMVLKRGRVTDLGGLMDADMRPGRFDERCQQEQPELLFLPHRNYKVWRREIVESACLTGYKRLGPKSSSPMYVRRDLVEKARCR